MDNYCISTMQPLTIDSSSEEGLKPDNFEHSIEFKDVNFCYPARPDVQVCIHCDCMYSDCVWLQSVVSILAYFDRVY